MYVFGGTNGTELNCGLLLLLRDLVSRLHNAGDDNES